MISLKTVAIIGVGSIGNRVAELISKERIKIIIVDRDIVEEHNLKTQLLYSKKDIGKPKANAAKEKLEKNNSDIKAFCEDLTFENINTILRPAKFIIDCTDNLETRFLINDYCQKNNKPWIYSAAIKDKATTINFFPGEACFRCIFKPTQGLDTCEIAGIEVETINRLAPIVVHNAKNMIAKKGVCKDMMRIDDDLLETIKIKKMNCPACKGRYEFLNGKIRTKPTKLCGSNTYQIKGSLKMKEPYKIIKDITLFQDGRAIIKAKSEREARSKYSKYVGN